MSYQTVSRTINDDPRVRRSTREAVEQAIAQLGYQPSAVARALKSGRTRTIGVLVEDLRQFGASSTLQGLSEAAGAESWELAIAGLDLGATDQVPGSLASVIQRRAQAIVLIGATEAVARAASLSRSEVPLLGTSQATEGLMPRSVEIDQRLGVRMAVEHLLERGCRAVAHISGPLQSLDAQLRAAETDAVLRRAGLRPAGREEGDWSAQSGYDAMRRLIGSERFDAAFVANDQMAIGALAALRRAGVRVPDAVALVGFDDIPEAPFSDPPLTTVRQDFVALGRALFSSILQATGGVPAAAPLALAPVMIRRSTA